MTAPAHRHPAGSPIGGQFAPQHHAEASVDLLPAADAAQEPAPDATAVLLSTIRRAIPDVENGREPTLTRAQMDDAVAQRLSGLDSIELAEQLAFINDATDRLADAQALDPDSPDLEHLEPRTASGISFDAVMADYNRYDDAVAEYRRELVDWWSANLHATVRNAVWLSELRSAHPDVLPWGEPMPAGH